MLRGFGYHRLRMCLQGQIDVVPCQRTIYVLRTASVDQQGCGRIGVWLGHLSAQMIRAQPIVNIEDVHHLLGCEVSL